VVPPRGGGGRETRRGHERRARSGARARRARASSTGARGRVEAEEAEHCVLFWVSNNEFAREDSSSRKRPEMNR
jgi:hypothetical protein